MKNLFNCGLILALVLCVADALGQSHPQHASQTKLAEEHSLLASSNTTVALGDSADLKFKLPAVLSIDHSDLGSLARAVRAARPSLPHARRAVYQDDQGRMVSEVKPDGTTDVWLYGVSQ